jgi:hypothetical protein
MLINNAGALLLTPAHWLAPTKATAHVAGQFRARSRESRLCSAAFRIAH